VRLPGVPQTIVSDLDTKIFELLLEDIVGENLGHNCCSLQHVTRKWMDKLKL
jgi:hypothetical protein